jgi:hypothetical protein
MFKPTDGKDAKESWKLRKISNYSTNFAINYINIIYVSL